MQGRPHFHRTTQYNTRKIDSTDNSECLFPHISFLPVLGEHGYHNLSGGKLPIHILLIRIFDVWIDSG